MPSVAIYFYVNLSPHVTKKSAKIFTKKTTNSCIVSLSLKANLSRFFKTLVVHEVFLQFKVSKHQYRRVVVNNNESKANSSILLHVSCSDLSPLGEAWLLSCCSFHFRSS